MPAFVVGMYAPFRVVGVYHATICMPWAYIVALWHAEDPMMGAYIATKGVSTYAPPPRHRDGTHLGPLIFRVLRRTCGLPPLAAGAVKIPQDPLVRAVQVMDQVHLGKVFVLPEPEDFVRFRIEELGLNA